MSIVSKSPSVAINHALSITSQVCDYLKIKVVRNSLLPGAKITETVLSQQLKISQTPLRAALQKVASESLFQTRRQVGSIIAKWNNAQLLEAVLIRAVLEIEVVRRLAETKPNLTPLEPVLAVQKRAVELDNYATFFGQDEVFHAKTAHIAEMPTTWKLAMSIKGHVDRQRYTIMSKFPKRLQQAFEGHIKIIEEIRSGSPSSAARAMRDHVHSVLELGLQDHETDLPTEFGQTKKPLGEKL